MQSIVCYCLDYQLHRVEISIAFLTNALLVHSVSVVFFMTVFADSVRCDKSSTMGIVSYPHV